MSVKEKITIGKCRSILKEMGKDFTDEEITGIRNYLYELAEIDYSVFISNDLKETVSTEQAKTINQNINGTKEEEGFKEAA